MITVVGDQHQSIFRWAGARPENINALSELLKDNITHRNLQSNYRSPPVHVELANLFRRGAEKYGIDPTPSVPKRASVESSLVIKEFQAIHEELSYISQEISRLIQSGVSPNDISILARTNKQLLDLESPMISRHIPYKIRQDPRSVIFQSPFRYIHAVMSLIINPNNPLAIGEILSNAKGIGPANLRKIKISLVPSSEIPVIQQLITLFKQTKKYHIYLPIVEEIIIPVLSVGIDQNPGRIAKSIFDRTQESVNLLSEEAQPIPNKPSLDISPLGLQKAVQTIINIQNIAISESYEPLTNKELFDHVYEILNLANDTATEDEDEPNKPRVALSTIHSFKGLESDYIFNSCLTNFKQTDPEDVEARCVFYVSITRAKKRMYMTSSRFLQGYDGRPVQGYPNPLFQEYISNIEIYKKNLGGQSK